jgi:hypothetical protein
LVCLSPREIRPRSRSKHVGHVHQPVEPAQIHEDAVVGDVLDPGLDRVALLDLVQKALAQDVPLLLEVRAPGDDHVGLLPGELEDLELSLDADDRIVVAYRPQVHLAAWKERLHADIHRVAALDLGDDRALHRRPLVEHPLQVLPHPDLYHLRAGEADEPLGLVVPFGHHLDRVPGLEGAALLLGEVLQRQHPLGLLVDVDGHEVLEDLDDLAVDHLPLFSAFEAGGEHAGEIFLPGRSPGGRRGIRLLLLREVGFVWFVIHATGSYWSRDILIYTVTRYW